MPASQRDDKGSSLVIFGKVVYRWDWIDCHWRSAGLANKHRTRVMAFAFLSINEVSLIMSIKTRMTPSVLAMTLLAPLCFHATQASAAHWSQDSNGYTLNCDIAVTNAPAGQWNKIEARFTLPVDGGSKLTYECVDAQGYTESSEGDRIWKYDFNCAVITDNIGSSVYVWHDMNTAYIQGLRPGITTQNFACDEIAKASKAQACKAGKAPPNCNR